MVKKERSTFFGGVGEKLLIATMFIIIMPQRQPQTVGTAKSERSHAMAKKKKLTKGLWSKDDVKLLKKLFPNRSTQEVADQLGRSLPSTRNKASKMELKKSKKYLKSLGRA